MKVWKVSLISGAERVRLTENEKFLTFIDCGEWSKEP
jgi:hypothetical protein